MRSQTLNHLLPALVKARSEMDNPKKGKVNPAFKSGYVDLPTLLECIGEPLRDNGLIIIHQLDLEHSGPEQTTDFLVTSIYHTESGEFIASRHPLRPVKSDPQGLGSAITYARRYSIMALLGLAAEDDDGNAASGQAAPKDPVADKMRQRGSGFSRKPSQE